MTYKTKLFCIPFAGGSASYYMSWKASLNPTIELLPIELAGRGYQYGSPFFETFDDAVENIYQYILTHADDQPYSIFGHSMGSLLAYQVTQKLNVAEIYTHSHLFLSAAKTPNVARNNKKFHLLTDDLLMHELIQFGGIPNEVYENPELLQILLPIIRADFRMLDTYKIKKNFPLLPQSVTIFGGLDDAFVSLDELKAWEQLTASSFKIHLFDGGHFYLNNHTPKIIRIINETLSDHQSWR